MRYFRVRTLDKHQHYKDRNPPWVKLHRGFRNDPDLCRLQDASRLLATCIVLLAAEHGNRLPWDESWLQGECHMKTVPDLAELQSIGFIELIEDASTVLADRLQPACPRDREQRTENRELQDQKQRASAREPEPASTALVVLPANGNGNGAHPAVVALQAVAQGTERRERRALYARAVARFVFGYWAARTGHRLVREDPKRMQRIAARLAEAGGDPRDLLYAVDGALRDDWIMGRKPNSDRKYDGVETIFRDRGQVERLAALVPAWAAGEPHPQSGEIAPLTEVA